MKKAQMRIDEFAFVLLAGLIFIIVLMAFWAVPEEAPSVSPTFKELVMRNGTTDRFSLNISGTRLTNVTLSSAGEIAGWLYFEQNNFDVTGWQTVSVEVRVPITATPGLHTGQIRVSSPGGQAIVDVQVHVLNVTAEPTERLIPLGDVEIRYLVGEDSLDRLEGVQVARGYLHDDPVYLVGVLSEEKLSIATGGQIRILIEDTNALGNLLVYFNDHKVYDARTLPGEILIPIKADLLNRSNRVTIRAGLPGWTFWASTVYQLRVAELSVSYEGTFFPRLEFELAYREVFGFDLGKLTFRIRNRTGDLSIWLNDQSLFEGVPPVVWFRQEFCATGRPCPDPKLPRVPLLVGRNTLSFAVTPGGHYTLENVALTMSHRF